jgi:hypothetical protein
MELLLARSSGLILPSPVGAVYGRRSRLGAARQDTTCTDYRYNVAAQTARKRTFLVAAMSSSPLLDYE